MLVFGLIAELLISAFQVTRFERQKMEAAEAGNLALNRVLSEIRESCRVEINAAKDQLTLTKFNAARVLDARTDANRYKYLLRVRYYKDSNGTLLREVSDLNAGSTDTHVVTDGLQGARFDIDPGSDNVVVTLTVPVKGRLRTLSSEVCPQAYIP